MRRSRSIRSGALGAAAVLAVGAGCTHNHYYYTTPGTMAVPGAAVGCDPVAPGAVISSTAPSVGAICDVPAQAQPGAMASQPGAMVAQNGPGAAPIVSRAARPIAPRPIYSQPAGRPGLRGGSGLVWRGTQPENLATTRIEGAYDDESTLK